MKLFIFFLSSMMCSVSALANLSNSVGQPIPPVLIEMVRCDVLSDDPYAGRVSFDIYISANAMDQPPPLESVPGAIVHAGIPFFGDTKMLFTTARITLSALDMQPIKFKAEVGEVGNETLILNADLFKEVDGSFTGSGIGELGPMGSAPLKCAMGTKKYG